MKTKTFIVIFINILVFISLFLICDYIVAKTAYMKSIDRMKIDIKNHNESTNNNVPKFLNKFLEQNPFQYNWNIYYFPKTIYDPDGNCSSRRQAKTQYNANKGSVIVFGCSFAYVSFLNNDETFEYQLMKATDRTVFNQGYPGFGMSPMVWLSKNEDFYENIESLSDTKPEYVIYIYIPDHIRRIYEERYGCNDFKTYIGFKKYNNELKENYPLYLQLNRFYIFRQLYRSIMEPYFINTKNFDKNFDLFKLYFKETRKEFQKHYPDIKFIIIKHPYGYGSESHIDSVYYSYETNRWKELEDDGFIVFDLKKEFNEDFSSDELTVPDGHPNAKAWSLVISKLVPKLNM